MSIRSTAKAIIIKDGKILLNKCRDGKNGDYYALPGGGQHTYESLHDAAVRECLEETGYKVKPVRFAALCEEICVTEGYREKYPDYSHKMYHIFFCELADENIYAPTEKDSMQIDSEWIMIKNLENIRLLPTAVGKNIYGIIDGTAQLFLGSEYVDFNHG